MSDNHSPSDAQSISLRGWATVNTGATGFIGSAIVSDMLKAGHQVVGLARSNAAAAALAAAGTESLRGELNDLESLRAGARETDATIHTVFDHDFSKLAETCEVDQRAIKAVGDALEESDKPFIVTSGLPVTPGRSATEDDEPSQGAHAPPRISEQAATSLMGRGFRPHVVRMSQAHDREKQGFASYLLTHARERGVSAYVGEGLNRWPAVHRLDAARLYRFVLEKGAAGQRYRAVGQDGVAVRDVAEAIGRRLQIPVAALPPDQSSIHFGWLDRNAKMDLPAVSSLTQERLGWRPTEHASLTADIENSISAPE